MGERHSRAARGNKRQGAPRTGCGVASRRALLETEEQHGNTAQNDIRPCMLHVPWQKLQCSILDKEKLLKSFRKSDQHL